MKTYSALFSFLALGLFACASAPNDTIDDSDDAVSEESALSAGIEPGTFKLYPSPNQSVAPGCDVYTRLDLTAKGSAKLENKLDALNGVCPMMFDPDLRTFRLKSTGESCGVKTYEGRKKRGRAISISDFRGTVCPSILFEAPIVVTETMPDGSIVKRYAANDTTPASVVKVDGGSAKSKSASLPLGSSLELSLDSNPTTGYRWQLITTDRTFGYPTKPEGDFVGPSSGAQGAGGQQVFTWAPNPLLTAGSQHKVTLGYLRPWETGVAPLKTFKLTVNVQAAAGGVSCGPNTCAVGDVCCNESCGICTPPGGACIQLACP